jgi:LemA protein
MTMKMTVGKWIALGVIALVLLGSWGSYNGFVSREEAVNGAWGEVQNQLKRRSDLIPNLVGAVKGYAGHEHAIFTEVTEARAKVSQVVSLDVGKLASDPALQKQFLVAQQGLSATLGRLLAVAEAYPQLKADQPFMKLQDELAGTENRIAVARGRANKEIQGWNTARRRFPASIIAGLGNFGPKPYYEAPAEEQKVPVVNFDKK